MDGTVPGYTDGCFTGRPSASVEEDIYTLGNLRATSAPLGNLNFAADVTDTFDVHVACRTPPAGHGSAGTPPVRRNVQYVEHHHYTYPVPPPWWQQGYPWAGGTQPTYAGYPWHGGYHGWALPAYGYQPHPPMPRPTCQHNHSTGNGCPVHTQQRQSSTTSRRDDVLQDIMLAPRTSGASTSNSETTEHGGWISSRGNSEANLRTNPAAQRTDSKQSKHSRASSYGPGIGEPERSPRTSLTPESANTSGRAPSAGADAAGFDRGTPTKPLGSHQQRHSWHDGDLLTPNKTPVQNVTSLSARKSLVPTAPSKTEQSDHPVPPSRPVLQRAGTVQTRPVSPQTARRVGSLSFKPHDPPRSLGEGSFKKRIALLHDRRASLPTLDLQQFQRWNLPDGAGSCSTPSTPAFNATREKSRSARGSKRAPLTVLHSNDETELDEPALSSAMPDRDLPVPPIPPLTKRPTLVMRRSRSDQDLSQQVQQLSDHSLGVHTVSDFGPMSRKFVSMAGLDANSDPSFHINTPRTLESDYAKLSILRIASPTSSDRSCSPVSRSPGQDSPQVDRDSSDSKRSQRITLQSARKNLRRLGKWLKGGHMNQDTSNDPDAGMQIHPPLKLSRSMSIPELNTMRQEDCSPQAPKKNNRSQSHDPLFQSYPVYAPPDSPDPSSAGEVSLLSAQLSRSVSNGDSGKLSYTNSNGSKSSRMSEFEMQQQQLSDSAVSSLVSNSVPTTFLGRHVEHQLDYSYSLGELVVYRQASLDSQGSGNGSTNGEDARPHNNLTCQDSGRGSMKQRQHPDIVRHRSLEKKSFVLDAIGESDASLSTDGSRRTLSEAEDLPSPVHWGFPPGKRASN